MKKKIMVLLVTSMFMCGGCGNTNESNETNQQQPQVVSDSSVEVETSIEKLEDEVPAVKEKTLDGLCAYMEDNSAVSGEKIIMASSMIGAEEGFKYKEIGVELYRFDEESDAYKGLLENGYVVLEGFDYKITPLSVVDGYIVIVAEETPDQETVKTVFEGYFND